MLQSRGRLGWLEPTHLLAPSMLYDFKGLYRATARNIADSQKQNDPNLGRVTEPSRRSFRLSCSPWLAS